MLVKLDHFQFEGVEIKQYVKPPPRQYIFSERVLLAASHFIRLPGILTKL